MCALQVLLLLLVVIYFMLDTDLVSVALVAPSVAGGGGSMVEDGLSPTDARRTREVNNSPDYLKRKITALKN